MDKRSLKQVGNKNKEKISDKNEKRNRLQTLPSIIQPREAKQKVVELVKEKLVRMNQQEGKERIEPEKKLKYGSFFQKYINTDHCKLEMNKDSSGKRQVYVFQDDLLTYLKSIENDFLIPQGKRKKIKYLNTGIDFFKRVHQERNLKADTLLLASFLWHKLCHDSSVTDSSLERYISPCLWIATKQEEYYPISARSICGYFDNFKMTKSDLKHLSMVSFTTEGLRHAEMEVLSLNGFKIFTPPLLSFLHILESEIFPTRAQSFTKSILPLIEAAYYQSDLFTFTLSSLAIACLSKVCSDKDLELNFKAVNKYVEDCDLCPTTSVVKAAKFLSDAVEQRRKFRLASLNNFIKEANSPRNSPL